MHMTSPSLMPAVGAHWCVARTRASAEHWAYVNLVRIGYDAYWPLCSAGPFGCMGFWVRQLLNQRAANGHRVEQG